LGGVKIFLEPSITPVPCRPSRSGGTGKKKKGWAHAYRTTGILSKPRHSENQVGAGGGKGGGGGHAAERKGRKKKKGVEATGIEEGPRQNLRPGPAVTTMRLIPVGTMGGGGDFGKRVINRGGENI